MDGAHWVVLYLESSLTFSRKKVISVLLAVNFMFKKFIKLLHSSPNAPQRNHQQSKFFNHSAMKQRQSLEVDNGHFVGVSITTTENFSTQTKKGLYGFPIDRSL